jgi:lysophospholipase L1-like esterase
MSVCHGNLDHMLIRALIAAVASLGLLVPTAACAASSDAVPDGPQRVMILGDSITQGALGHHTWRYFFAQATPGVDFVGNKQGTFSIYGGDWDYRGANAYAVSGWDSDHAAVWGGSMTNPNPEPKLYQLPIGELSATYQPDVIMSAWGINDLNAGTKPADLIAFYRGWIADAREQQPDVDFVIAALPWRFGALNPVRVDEFNGMLDNLAATEGTDASRVVIARMEQPYTKDADTYDGIHPNQQGEQKIAGMMGAAYDSLASDPAAEPTAVEPATEAATNPAAVATPETAAPLVRPDAPRRFRAIERGRFVVAKWREADVATAYAVRCGSSRKVVNQPKVKLRTNATRCVVRAINEAGKSPAARTTVR